MPARDRSTSALWIVTLLLIAAFVAWDALGRSKHLLLMDASYGVTVDQPATDASSPTGYEDGRRSLVLPTGGADSAHWIMQTQRMLADGPSRIRHVDYDNAPDGRAVHWGSPFRWWLGLVSWFEGALSGRPTGIAVERATLWSGPLMLGLALPPLMLLLHRRFSPMAAALAAIGSVAFFPFYIDFIPARADHHGIANLCGLFTVLFLLTGCCPRSRRTDLKAANESAPAEPARRWFVASALAGGLGLWISTATQVPILIGTGLGVLAAAWSMRGKPEKLVWMRHPELLALWGRVGGAASLAAYLIEYFPSHLGMRLEVNHPLYALAWVGAGELLRLMVMAIQPQRPMQIERPTLRVSLALAAVALLPLMVLTTGRWTFTVSDPFVWQLHALHIAEFQSMVEMFRVQGLTWHSLGLLLTMLLLAPPVILACRSGTSPDARALLLLALFPALLAWVLGWYQVRWLGLAFALTVPLIGIHFRTLESTIRGGFPWRAALLGLVFVPGAISAVQRSQAAREFSTADIRSLAERDIAHWLRIRSGDARPVVSAPPGVSTTMIYHGSLSGVGTLYWENAEGLKRSAALYGASSLEAAHQIVRDAGISHFVFLSWEGFEVAYAKLDRGLPGSAPLPQDAFVARALRGSVPWLRALPFQLPDHPALEGDRVLIWEVTDEMTPVEQAVAAAGYALEMGLPDEGARLVPVLRQYPNDLAANIMLAGIFSRQGNASEFGSVFTRILAQLPQATTLPPGHHIQLVMVLAVAERFELGRQHLQQTLAKIDEASLRRLTPATLSDLLTLMQGFELRFEDPSLTFLAERVLPPRLRR